VVCRENVARTQESLSVFGAWAGRESGFSSDAVPLDQLLQRIAGLRRDLERQAPDKEAVLAAIPAGEFVWRPAQGAFAERYAPELIYPIVERHVARARGDGLRVTGYLEALEKEQTTFATGGLTLSTHDHGVTISLTVDDPRTGTVGAASRAATAPSAAELDALVGAALDDALRICRTSAGPAELAPGDYTVVLHPSAVYDLVNTALVYGLFDRRKVDEGRTFLSRKLGELRFPDGLSLSQTLALPLAGGATYADSPFNDRLVPCGSLRLIEDGRVRDLHTTPFWAKTAGHPETFSPGSAPPVLLAAAAGSPLAGRYRTTQDLIASTERGVFVCNTWYLRMVAEMDGVITGMTRDGLYAIEDGKLTRPLINMRWHDNPLRVLSAVSAVSDERQLIGLSRLAGRARNPLGSMPALRVESFHFSSATRF
jgi:predicted Zn-dependent protease